MLLTFALVATGISTSCSAIADPLTEVCEGAIKDRLAFPTTYAREDVEVSDTGVTVKGVRDFYTKRSDNNVELVRVSEALAAKNDNYKKYVLKTRTITYRAESSSGAKPLNKMTCTFLDERWDERVPHKLDILFNDQSYAAWIKSN